MLAAATGVRQSTRKRTHVPTYRSPAMREFRRESSDAESRWQRNWNSDDDDIKSDCDDVDARVLVNETTLPTVTGVQYTTRQLEQRERKRTRIAAVMKATAAAQHSTVKQSAEQRNDDARTFMNTMRNQNTHTAYESGWKQFVQWVETVENASRTPQARIDVERPTEWDVAQYCRYVVMIKRNTMSSVQGALAAIADHLRFVMTKEYTPCGGRVIKQMLAVLLPLATPPQQKKELSFEAIAAMVGLAKAVHTETSLRDACMISLAYHTFLRASEVARMTRADITFTRETVWGEQHDVMRVHVNRLCKNDTERKGHERLVLEREISVDLCLVRQMRAYLKLRNLRGDQPLFPIVGGTAHMSINTPNHRVKYWLQQVGVNDVSEFGFHSLRAGGATDAATAGVHERDIKAHGNWKSEAVRVYIRPSLEDRLMVSEALAK